MSLEDINISMTAAEVKFDNKDYLGALTSVDEAWNTFTEDLSDPERHKAKELQTAILELKLKIQKDNSNTQVGAVSVLFELCKANLRHAPYFFEAATLLRQVKRFQDAFNFCEYSCDLDGRNTRARLLLNALNTDLKIGAKMSLTTEVQDLNVPDIEIFRVTAGIVRQNSNYGSLGSNYGSRPGSAVSSPTKPDDAAKEAEEQEAAEVEKKKKKRAKKGRGFDLSELINQQGKKAMRLVALPAETIEAVFAIDIVAIVLLLGFAFCLNKFVCGCWAVVPVFLVVTQFHHHIRKLEKNGNLEDTAYFGVPPAVFSSFALCLAFVGGLV